MSSNAQSKPSGTGKPSASQRVFSGRGGAGNVAPISPSLTPADLETPTIKQSNYTTGRGGSGNIVSNDNPENARKAQDVGAPAAAAAAAAAKGKVFELDDAGKGAAAADGSGAAAGETVPGKIERFGRGGAANVVRGSG